VLVLHLWGNHQWFFWDIRMAFQCLMLIGRAMVVLFSVPVGMAQFVYGIPKQLALMAGYRMYHNKKAAQAAAALVVPPVRHSVLLKFRVQKRNHSSRLAVQLWLSIEVMPLERLSGPFRLLHAATTLLQLVLITLRGYLQQIDALPCVY
jgi:hypothetical protein